MSSRMFWNLLEKTRVLVGGSSTDRCSSLFHTPMSVYIFFVFMEVKGRLFANLREVSRVNKFDNTATAHVLFINKT